MVFYLGDIHLRVSKKGVNWQANGLAIIQFVKSLGIKPTDTVIQCGDVFDRNRSEGVVNQMALDLFITLRGLTPNVWVINGNHDDEARVGSALLALIPLGVNVVIDPRKVEIEGKSFLFLPHQEKYKLGGAHEAWVAQEFSGIYDVIVGHGALQSSAVMDMPYFDFQKSGIRCTNAVFGDIHKPSQCAGQNGALLETSTGSLWSTNKSETGTKQYFTMDGAVVTPHDIDPKWFSQFVTVDFPSTKKVKVPEKDFLIVQASCKREEKFQVETDLRKAYQRNVYEIEWLHPKEAGEVGMGDIKSEADIEKAFFAQAELVPEVKSRVAARLQGA